MDTNWSISSLQGWLPTIFKLFLTLQVFSHPAHAYSGMDSVSVVRLEAGQGFGVRWEESGMATPIGAWPGHGFCESCEDWSRPGPGNRWPRMAWPRPVAVWLAKAAWKDKFELRYELSFSGQCFTAGCGWNEICDVFWIVDNRLLLNTLQI